MVIIKYVLDGQQRITSIYLTIKGKELFIKGGKYNYY